VPLTGSETSSFLCSFAFGGVTEQQSIKVESAEGRELHRWKQPGRVTKAIIVGTVMPLVEPDLRWWNACTTAAIQQKILPLPRCHHDPASAGQGLLHGEQRGHKAAILSLLSQPLQLGDVVLQRFRTKARKSQLAGQKAPWGSWRSRNGT